MRGRIDVEVQRLQELLAGDVDAAQPVEALVVGQIDVLRDGERGHQARLLVDHRDAALRALPTATAVRPSLPSIQISPAVGCDDAGEHLGQRRLAGAVLAEQRMHLAAMKREGHVLHRRRRRDTPSCALRSSTIGVMPRLLPESSTGSETTTPSPRAATKTCPSMLGDAGHAMGRAVGAALQAGDAAGTRGRA